MDPVVLGALITSVFGLLLAAYNAYSAQKAKREELDSTVRLRSEPTYAEIVQEARNLRSDLVKQEARYRDLADRVEKLEDEKELMERAAKSILYTTYGAFPKDYPPPMFDKDDLDAIPHLVHPAWRYNYRTS